MCLIVFAYRCHPKYSLVLLANRDEFYQRPTRAMQFWPEQPDILAGQDLEQKGTWLGISRTGRFAAITNYRDGIKTSNSGHSRGQLTGDFLQGTLSAPAYLQQLESRQQLYPGYNLLIGDNRGLYYSSNRGSNSQLQPGFYGLSNALLNSHWPKLEQSKSGLQRLLDEEDPSEERLLQLMLSRWLPNDADLPDTGVGLEWERRLAPCFIESPEVGYGTRATSLVLQQPDGQTRMIEVCHDQGMESRVRRFDLQVPPLGADL